MKSQNKRKTYNTEICNKFNSIVIEWSVTELISDSENESEILTQTNNGLKYLTLTTYIILSVCIVMYSPVFIIGVILTIPFMFVFAPELTQKQKDAISNRQEESLKNVETKTVNEAVENVDLGKTSLKLATNLISLFVLSK